MKKRECLALALVAALLLMPVAFAHAVTMNFRFHVQDINDHIRVNDEDYIGQSVNKFFPSLRKKYISAERSGVAAALLYAGTTFLVARLDTTQDPYLFQMTQDEQENRFIVALTQGDWTKIEEKANNNIPTRTFGNLAANVAAKVLFAQHQSDIADLIGTIAQGSVTVKNVAEGRIPTVQITQIG